MKRIAVILICVFMLAAVSGCGGAKPGNNANAAEGAAHGEPAVTEEPVAMTIEDIVGWWHIDESCDMDALSEVFPGTAEFGSGMELRPDGSVSWYIGADGAEGAYTSEGTTLIANVMGELDAKEHQVTLQLSAPDKIIMNYRDTEIVWVYSRGESNMGSAETEG